VPGFQGDYELKKVLNESMSNGISDLQYTTVDVSMLQMIRKKNIPWRGSLLYGQYFGFDKLLNGRL
jgi:hypothetical protein